MNFCRKSKLSIYILLTLFLISGVSALCLDSPSYIEVISGSNSLGPIPLEEVESKGVHIREDLDTYPLKVRLGFEDIDEDCFDGNDAVELRLFPDGISIPANSISTKNDDTIAEFSYDINTLAPDSFKSTYTIKNKQSSTASKGSIRFLVDEQKPNLDISTQPNLQLVKPETSIRIDYFLEDIGSGLSSLIITGGINDAINFDNNQTHSGYIIDNLTSSTSYSFTLKDKLGNQNQKDLRFIVDSKGPHFSDLKIKGYSKDSSNNRYVSLSLVVEDESYEFDNNIPEVFADLSSINQNAANQIGDCKSLDDTSYECVWENIKITGFVETSRVEFKFRSSDSVGNLGEATFSEEIFYDSNGPQIDEFYLENSMGKKNIFNTQDSSVIVKLSFSDESLNNFLDLNEFSVIDDFDESFFVIPQINFSKNKRGVYVWNVTDYIKKYSGMEKGSLPFRVTVYDSYGNPTSKEINVSFNNNMPSITNIEFIENDYSSDGAIKDGIITSGERINFKLFVEDDNLELSEDFIYANFYPISADDDMRKVPASCYEFNETTYQCDYSGIVVDNGHLETQVSFYVIDTAGNVQKEDFPIEIFAIGDEVPSSFDIEDIEITNVLNRNYLKNPTGGVVDAWFEGEIEDIEDRGEDMIVVNYRLKSCNDSALNPILLGERNLFPEEIVSADNGAEAPREFVLKTEVKAYAIPRHLNNKSMDCTISILKRDNETLYPAELVDFNLKYEFYDLPNDNLLNAQAEKILEVADEVEWLGSWFDSTWDVYDTMKTVCEGVQTVRGVMGAIETIWNPVCMVLTKIPATKDAAGTIDNFVKPSHAILSKLAGGDIPVITKMCKFVNCQLGYNELVTGKIDGFFEDWGDLGAGSGLCSLTGVNQGKGVSSPEDEGEGQ